MKHFSVGVSMAWQIAAGAAASGKHESIEKEHLLIGLFSLEKLVELGEEKFGLSARAWMSLINEYRVLEKLLFKYNVTSARIRRAVRSALPAGTFNHTEDIIHRSDVCVAVFDRAGKLAESTGTNYFSSLHLLAAILKDPGDIIKKALEDADIMTPLFHQHVVNMATRKREYFGQLDSDERQTLQTFAGARDASSLTVLFDDIVLSADISASIDETFLSKVVERHNQAVEKLLAKTSAGEIVKSTGNGLLMVFSSCHEAVETALKIQKAFEKLEAFKLRMGMDTGAIDRTSSGTFKDLSGDAVDSSYHLTRLAAGGHVLVSEGVFKKAATMVPRSISWNRFGTHTITIGEPAIEVYEAYDPQVTTPMATMSDKKLSDDLKRIDELFQ